MHRIFIAGASGGIGEALVETVPWSDVRVVRVSRRRPAWPERSGSPVVEGIEHAEADLADLASWPRVSEVFRKELASTDGERVAFVQAHGTVDPVGFVGEVDDDEYATNVASTPLSRWCSGTSHRRRARRRGHAPSADPHVRCGPGVIPAGRPTERRRRPSGAEQETRGGVTVLVVGPGTVDTGMQAQLREASEDDFPSARSLWTPRRAAS